MGGSEARLGLGLGPLAQAIGWMMGTRKQSRCGNSLLVGRWASVGTSAPPERCFRSYARSAGHSKPCSCNVALATGPMRRGGGPYLWPAPLLPTWCPASSWVSLASCRWPPCPCCSAAGWGRGRGSREPRQGCREPLPSVPSPGRLSEGGGQELGRRGLCFPPEELGWFPWERKGCRLGNRRILGKVGRWSLDQCQRGGS